ncbi:TonB-dependent receptor [Aquimarina sp. 2201CG5-10]|uniref:SusC/RagA family TonB-linked outer membrane protein n=1 Tax=Aquimarina callyspongiae TaxID=3098150 RepID=UPI002AB39C44|nr:TonB-dependent receptor [Aquimarina sp. 2201CG5-10]MDY8134357.1 TonB-dependent receptor [Aquimarina sp. 2201CG5-10]
MRLKLLFTILFSLVMQVILSQELIKGTITDERKIPMSGASIIVKGTTNGTTTDFDGNFVIEANIGDILSINYLGFLTKEITITTNEDYSIVLEEDHNQLEQVVVVGYGTQNKAILTSSVSTISNAELIKEPVVNVTQSLQGKAAGVQIIASDAPGQASTVIIRGLGTIQGGRAPLYVVDGILTDNINNINSFDITSVNVLKDAASLAIYGNRGANGVIIITTKKGKTGKMQLSFDSYTGFRDILSTVEMANASQFVTYSNEAILRDLLSDNDPNNDNDTSGFFSINQPYDTDWLDVITRTGRISNYNLSLSGGSENVQAFFSAGFNEEEGILRDNDFNRLTLRSNVNYKISDKFNFSHNVSAQLASITPQDFTQFTTAYKQSPIVPVVDENGRFGSSAAFNNVGNPVVNRLFNESEQKFLKLQGAFKFDYKIFEPLTYTSRFSIEAEYGRFYNFQDRLGLFLASNPANLEENFDGGIENPARTRLTVTHTNNYRWFLDNYFTYKKTFNDDHTIKATLGITAEESGGEFLTGTRNNVPLDRNLRFNLNIGDQDDTQLSGGAQSITDKLYSYIARVNYDYKDKYLFNASYRRDGSSRFQKGNRFGNFYAISAGWVISEEDFMQNGIFDLLKLRGSYGELGNQNVPFNVLTATTGSGGFYAFGPNQDLQQGITITGIVQENLTWETTEEFNIGLEYALFNKKLNGEIDYYERTNTNATLQLELPDVFGFDPFNSHVGEVSNKGLEIAINWSDQINEKLSYSIGGNFSYNKNELTKVTSPFFNEQLGGFINNGQYTKKVAEGEPLGSFFLYEVAGIDDNGEFIYTDLNENGITDEGDRKFFGSYIPKYFFGFNVGIDYGNFDFSIDTFGNFGNKIYNGKKAQRFGNENIELSVFNDRWTSGRPNSPGPIASNEVPLSSNYYLESGDFFRINNVTLGYTLPKEILKFFSKVRIYASAKNPVIFKKFSGFTPELSGNGDGNPLGTAGIELDAYPTLRSFYMGINTSF